MQPAYSLLQLVCPKSATAPTAVNIAASDDASVFAGAQDTANFGGATTLTVSLSSSTSQATTAAALIKFPLGALTAGKVCHHGQFPLRWLTRKRHRCFGELILVLLLGAYAMHMAAMLLTGNCFAGRVASLSSASSRLWRDFTWPSRHDAQVQAALLTLRVMASGPADTTLLVFAVSSNWKQVANAE